MGWKIMEDWVKSSLCSKTSVISSDRPKISCRLTSITSVSAELSLRISWLSSRINSVKKRSVYLKLSLRSIICSIKTRIWLLATIGWRISWRDLKSYMGVGYNNWRLSWICRQKISKKQLCNITKNLINLRKRDNNMCSNWVLRWKEKLRIWRKDWRLRRWREEYLIGYIGFDDGK